MHPIRRPAARATADHPPAGDCRPRLPRPLSRRVFTCPVPSRPPVGFRAAAPAARQQGGASRAHRHPATGRGVARRTRARRPRAGAGSGPLAGLRWGTRAVASDGPARDQLTRVRHRPGWDRPHPGSGPHGRGQPPPGVSTARRTSARGGLGRLAAAPRRPRPVPQQVLGSPPGSRTPPRPRERHPPRRDQDPPLHSRPGTASPSSSTPRPPRREPWSSCPAEDRVGARRLSANPASRVASKPAHHTATAGLGLGDVAGTGGRRRRGTDVPENAWFVAPGAREEADVVPGTPGRGAPAGSVRGGPARLRGVARPAPRTAGGPPGRHPPGQPRPAGPPGRVIRVTGKTGCDLPRTRPSLAVHEKGGGPAVKSSRTREVAVR